MHFPDVGRRRGQKFVATLAVALGLLAAGGSAFAQLKGLNEPGRDDYLKTMKGKTVAYLPIALSFDLTRGWLEGVPEVERDEVPGDVPAEPHRKRA